MFRIKVRDISAPGRAALGLLIFIITSLILSVLLTEALYSGRTGETQVTALSAAVMFISALTGSFSAALGRGERRRNTFLTVCAIILLRIVISLTGGEILSAENILLTVAAAVGCIPAIIASRRPARSGRKRHWAK